MRHLAHVIAVAVVIAPFLSAATAAAEGGARTSLTDLAWMAGSWSNTDNGKVSEEYWTAPAGNLMLGIHRDVDGERAAFEYLRIEQLSTGITMLASPQGRPATPFALVESGKERAVFANPEHDFPKKILYWREGASLCAAIEGPMQGETVRESWCWKPPSAR